MTRLGMICDLVALAVLGLALAAPSCERPEPEPPTPPATGGAATGGAPATGGTATGGLGTGGGAPADDCDRAEARIRELGCRTDGAPRWQTPAGTPLAEVCRARAADHDSMCPKCLAAIATCSEIDECKPTVPNECGDDP